MVSGFSCVALKALTKLASVSVYSPAVMKQRRYWPKHIRGDDIDKRFENMEVVVVACHARKLEQERFVIFCMKEEDYVMKQMATYGALKMGGDKSVTRQSVTKMDRQKVNVAF